MEELKIIPFKYFPPELQFPLLPTGGILHHEIVILFFPLFIRGSHCSLLWTDSSLTINLFLSVINDGFVWKPALLSRTDDKTFSLFIHLTAFINCAVTQICSLLKLFATACAFPKEIRLAIWIVSLGFLSPRVNIWVRTASEKCPKGEFFLHNTAHISWSAHFQELL